MPLPKVMTSRTASALVKRRAPNKPLSRVARGRYARIVSRGRRRK